MFQSTPPRGRRLPLFAATTKAQCFNPRLRVGGDRARKGALYRHEMFQSTPPRGRRQHDKDKDKAAYVFQSTPPRGRRPSAFRSNPEGTVFQSTPPRGRRRWFDPWAKPVLAFQSTPPRGRRLARFQGLLLLFGFNPRLRVGGDPEEIPGW